MDFKSTIFAFLLSTLFTVSATAHGSQAALKARCTFGWNEGVQCDSRSMPAEEASFERSGTVCVSPWSDIEDNFSSSQQLADEAATEACTPGQEAIRTSAYREERRYGGCPHGQTRFTSSASYRCKSYPIKWGNP